MFTRTGFRLQSPQSGLRRPHQGARPAVCTKDRIVTRTETGQKTVGLAAGLGLSVRTVRLRLVWPRADGRTALVNRASVPARVAEPVPDRMVTLAPHLRRSLRLTGAEIARRPGGLARSTVARWLARNGTGRKATSTGRATASAARTGAAAIAVRGRGPCRHRWRNAAGLCRGADRRTPRYQRLAKARPTLVPRAGHRGDRHLCCPPLPPLCQGAAMAGYPPYLDPTLHAKDQWHRPQLPPDLPARRGLRPGTTRTRRQNRRSAPPACRWLDWHTRSRLRCAIDGLPRGAKAKNLRNPTARLGGHRPPRPRQGYFTRFHVPPSRQMNSTHPSTASPSPVSCIFDL